MTRRASLAHVSSGTRRIVVNPILRVELAWTTSNVLFTSTSGGDFFFNVIYGGEQDNFQAIYIFFRNKAGELKYRKLVDKDYIVIDPSHYQPLVTEEEKKKELLESASGRKFQEDKVP